MWHCGKDSQVQEIKTAAVLEMLIMISELNCDQLVALFNVNVRLRCCYTCTDS